MDLPVYLARSLELARPKDGLILPAHSTALGKSLLASDAFPPNSKKMNQGSDL